MNVVWFCFGAGVLLILLRRPYARSFVKSQEFWFDRIYDEDEVVFFPMLMGGLFIAAGVVFLGIWIFN